MVYIQSIKKRGFLRQVAQGAKRGSDLLKDALLSAQGAVYSANFQRGRLLISTSGSGQQGSFEIGVQGKEWTQDNVFALTEELIELLEAILTAGLGVDSGDPSDTDALMALMLQDQSLQGVSELMGDYTNLNVPSWGGIPS